MLTFVNHATGLNVTIDPLQVVAINEATRTKDSKEVRVVAISLVGGFSFVVNDPQHGTIFSVASQIEQAKKGDHQCLPYQIK